MKDRRLPFDREIEKAILGSMLRSEKAVYTAIEYLKENMFFDPAHRDIFRAIAKVVDERKGVDTIIVSEYLEKEGVLEKIGGMEYLVSLEDFALNPAYIEEYIKTLTEKYLYRKAIELCEETIKLCEQEEDKAEEILDELDRKIFDLRQVKVREGLVPLTDLVNKFFEEFRGEERGRGIYRILTGYIKLDELTGGFHSGDFVVIASRPSVGKTSFVINLMYRMAKHHNVPSALFSVEMSKLQIAQRFLVLESKIDSHKFRRMDRLSEDETRRLLYAADALKDLPIYIDDTPRLSIQELRAKARRACYEHNVKIIFIDYIQLLTGPRFDTRQRELAYISASLKSLAKELDIPVVALSQLSRKVEERKEEEGAPRLSDLRESGALEQEADIVIFLYRPQVEEIVLGEPYREVPIAFSVAKNRNGPQGKFELYFIKEYMQFENIEAVEEREEAEDVLPF